MMNRVGRRRSAPLAAVVVVLLLLPGCGTTTGEVAPGPLGSRSALAASASAGPGSDSQTKLPKPRPPAGLPWRRVAGSPMLAVASLGSGRVSLLWMDATHLRFRYVPGTQVPEGGPATAADNNPSTWVPRMIAGFNGGFRLSDHVGGYYYRGRTVAPLRRGAAGFAITRAGALSVGVWGRDLRMRPNVVVVRQDFGPLVDHGVSQASPSDGPQAWGLADQNLPLANRSALGSLPDGSLVFGYGASVLPTTLASSLVRAGVVEAVMLDMNISWPTGFVYRHAGGRVTGMKINAAIVRPPSTYNARFEKDFIAVLTRRRSHH
jgi:hypothetical protein